MPQQQSTKKGQPSINVDMLKPIIKSLLVDSTVLTEAFSESQLLNSQIEAAENLIANNTFIDIIVGKLTEKILANEEFQTAISMNLSTLVEAKTSSLNEKIEELNGKLDKAAQENESLEQYSRRNCLLFHGLKEEENENTNNLIIKFIDEKLGLPINEHDLDRSHRLGYRHSSASAQTTKPRPIIVKCIRHDIKEKIFGTKKDWLGNHF